MLYADFEYNFLPQDNGKENPRESYTNKSLLAISWGTKIFSNFA